MRKIFNQMLEKKARMTQKVNVSEKTIKRELAILQGKGFLAREGGRKEGKWICRCPYSQLLGRHP